MCLSGKLVKCIGQERKGGREGGPDIIFTFCAARDREREVEAGREGESVGEREGGERGGRARSLSLARCSLARSLSAAGDLRRRGEGGGRGGNGIRRSNAASESNLGILARWLQGFWLGGSRHLGYPQNFVFAIGISSLIFPSDSIPLRMKAKHFKFKPFTISAKIYT